MSQRSFSILLLVTLLTAGVSFLLLTDSQSTQENINDLFLPEVGTQINTVQMVTVTNGGGERSTLVLGDSHWVIKELNNYPVDWKKLRSALAALAEARISEAKTSNPKYYSRLGVEAVTEEGAQGHLVQLAQGENLTGIIVGNGATSREGQYVRLADGVQSVLIDQSIEVDSDPVFWINDEIVDIGSALVAEIEITHPDGDFINIRKIWAGETDFKLENMPEGREIISSWTVNSLANTFSSLSLESVIPDDGKSTVEPIRIELLTFSGIGLQAELVNDDDGSWIRLKATAPEPSDSGLEDELSAQAANELIAETKLINNRVAGWLYRIPASKSESMSKRLDQLLIPLDDNSGT